MNLLDAAMATLVLVMWVVVGLGARWRPAVMVGLSAWLAVTGGLAAAGLLEGGTPPRVLALPVTAFTVIVLNQNTAFVLDALDRIPRRWPVMIQSFRVLVEALLYALYAAGRAPVQMTFEGRNADILVGLTAPLAAGWLIWRPASTRVALAWNALGLAVLLNTIATAATSVPGPLYVDWGGGPLTVVMTWPMVWLPAFLAPLAVFLHLFSIRQVLRAA